MKRLLCLWIENLPNSRPDQTIDALKAIAAWCKRFTPLVGIDPALLRAVEGENPLFHLGEFAFFGQLEILGSGNRRQNADDQDDDHQFNKGEAATPS